MNGNTCAQRRGKNRRNAHEKTRKQNRKSQRSCFPAAPCHRYWTSAGGLEALQQFFDYMPPNSGLSFVVVQHLSPDYKSLMADILGKHTEMAVYQAEDSMAVEGDTVYLIPPKKYLEIREGRLRLSDAPGTLNHPIDAFFTSLAEEKKEHSIVVVLSGTGSDGTKGVKAVKEHGGLVIAQDPDSAKFDGMPRSVIHTGLADFVLSPEEIAEEI